MVCVCVCIVLCGAGPTPTRPHARPPTAAASHQPQPHFTKIADGFGKPCGTEFAEDLARLYQAHRGPLLGFHMQVRRGKGGTL